MVALPYFNAEKQTLLGVSSVIKRVGLNLVENTGLPDLI
jgi:hypothetical protein